MFENANTQTTDLLVYYKLIMSLRLRAKVSLKGGNIDFLDAQEQLTLWCLIRSDRISTHPSSHVCYHYLQLEKDPIKSSREKVETSFFSHYKPMGNFSDTQGQQTQQSVVQSRQK